MPEVVTHQLGERRMWKFAWSACTVAGIPIQQQDGRIGIADIRLRVRLSMDMESMAVRVLAIMSLNNGAIVLMHMRRRVQSQFLPWIRHDELGETSHSNQSLH